MRSRSEIVATLSARVARSVRNASDFLSKEELEQFYLAAFDHKEVLAADVLQAAEIMLCNPNVRVLNAGRSLSA